jgi:hypothetical protein
MPVNASRTKLQQILETCGNAARFAGAKYREALRVAIAKF